MKSTFDIKSLAIGALIGAGLLFLALDRESPIVSRIAEGWVQSGPGPDKELVERAAERFEEVATLVSMYHPDEVTDKDFLAMIDKGMEHFGRFDGAYEWTMDEAVEASVGEKGQMGWYVRQADDVYIVDFVGSGSPAERAGFRQGDIILTSQDPDKAIRENEDPVLFQVNQGGEINHVYAWQEPYSLPSVLDFGVEQGVLHVVMRGFTPGSSEELRDVIDAHYADIRGVVIDLRRNGGGYLDEARAMLEDFLPAGVNAFTSRGRFEGTKPFMTREAERWPGLEVAIIINGRSASCSEVFAGAMKQAGRADVVGWTSLGKGAVQRSVNSRHGGGFRVTVAYYTVGEGEGVEVEGLGVEPTFKMAGPDPMSVPARDAVYRVARSFVN